MEMMKRKPNLVVFSMTHDEFIAMAEEAVLKKTGVELDLVLYVDDETGKAYYGIDEEMVTEEENDKLTDAGFYPQEWFIFTNTIIEINFGSEAYAYVDMEEYELLESIDQLTIPVTIPYDDYVKYFEKKAS